MKQEILEDIAKREGKTVEEVEDANVEELFYRREDGVYKEVDLVNAVRRLNLYVSKRMNDDYLFVVDQCENQGGKGTIFEVNMSTTYMDRMKTAFGQDIIHKHDIKVTVFRMFRTEGTIAMIGQPSSFGECDPAEFFEVRRVGEMLDKYMMAYGTLSDYLNDLQ